MSSLANQESRRIETRVGIPMPKRPQRQSHQPESRDGEEADDESDPQPVPSPLGARQRVDGDQEKGEQSQQRPRAPVVALGEKGGKALPEEQGGEDECG